MCVFGAAAREILYFVPGIYIAHISISVARLDTVRPCTPCVLAEKAAAPRRLRPRETALLQHAASCAAGWKGSVMGRRGESTESIKVRESCWITGETTLLCTVVGL